MINDQPLRIAVLAGGKSRERNISLESGDAVAKGLSERGHIVTRIDPAQIELTTLDWTGYDVAFLALHGTFGEDGHVQQILEEAGIPFTGSDSTASRLARTERDESFRACESFERQFEGSSRRHRIPLHKDLIAHFADL